MNIVLKSFIQILAGNNIKWFTDNQNVVKIIDTGSGKPELQELAKEIYSTCIQNNINLKIDWIPRSENEKADSLSRIIDYDDWSISHTLFTQLEQLWGPHTVDRFANFQNCKIPRVYSRFWNLISQGVDAFTVQWSGENICTTNLTNFQDYFAFKEYQSNGHPDHAKMDLITFLASFDNE